MCTRCSTCCRDKRIQVGPYEVARLARKLGCSTTDFVARWTVDGQGTVLRQADSGACVFLGGDGCTVHEDRPLVCRLFPLGRHTSPDGAEHFTLVPASMRPVGEITRDGTIDDFLSAQEAAPFMHAADGYFAWLSAAHRLLAGMPAEHGGRAIGEQGSALIDMDRALARHECETQLPSPDDIEARRELHLRILYRRLDRVQEEAELVEGNV